MINQIKLKTLFLVLICILVPFNLYADCFIIKDWATDSVVFSEVSEEGACQKRVSPCSTFKIPLALMGFDSKILKDPKTPISKLAPTPMDWIQNSCVWFSQTLTKKLGFKKFKHYVDLFKYGNQDLSGDPHKKNGLTQAWLSSSLKISAIEQLEFLLKFLDKSLPVSEQAIEKTKEMLFISDLDKNWKLFGKTGLGDQLDAKGIYHEDKEMGWFIGWIYNSKLEKTYMFVYLLDYKPEHKENNLKAKDLAIDKIKHFLKKN